MSGENGGTAVDVRPDGRATRWDGHKNERRQLILQAAIAAIGESGGEIGVQQIADRAGLPRSVIYRIFKDRDDLDEQIRTQIVADCMAELTPTLTPEGTIEASIKRAIETYVQWVIEHPRLHQFLGTGSAARRTTNSRIVTGTKTAIGMHITKLIETAVAAAGADSRIAETMAFGIIGLVDGSVNRWVGHAQPNVTSADVVQFLTDSVFQILHTGALNAGLDVQRDLRIHDVS